MPMIKYALFVALIAAVWCGLPACKVQRERSALALEAKDSLLYGAWMHSQEEDQDGLRVYRRVGFKFPPSRGREGMEFLANGVLVYDAIGPTDVPLHLPGTWGFSGKSALRLTLENGRQFSLQLKQAEKDKLVGRWEEQ